MAAPKKKHTEPARRARPVRPTSAEREATEDRADAEAYERAKAEWEAAGRPAPIPWEQVESELDARK